MLTEVAPAAVPEPGAVSPLSEVGGPLNWSDIIPGWPDDVDLDPESGPAPPSDGASAAASTAYSPADVSPVVVAEPETSSAPGFSAADASGGGRAVAPLRPKGELPAAPAWPTSPGPIEASIDLGEPFLAPAAGLGAESSGRRPLPRPSWTMPAPRSPAPCHDAGDPAKPFANSEPFGSSAPIRHSESFGSVEAFGGSESFGSAEADDGSPRLSAAGAFGGGLDADRGRIGLRAFDPGRPGVKALAAVVAVVIVVAAVLAWRARPHVESVAPPSFDPGAVATTSEGARHAPVAATGGAGASAAASEVVVAVAGKVRKPGLVHLPSGARVADALAAAGGAEPGVDVAMLNLARKVVDGELILVGVTPPPGSTVATGPAAPATGGVAPAGGPINLNTATLTDLDTLPGVGPVLAQRILDARDVQGGFKAVSDLRKVNGIGDARYEQLKDLVTV